MWNFEPKGPRGQRLTQLDSLGQKYVELEAKLKERIIAAHLQIQICEKFSHPWSKQMKNGLRTL